MYRNETSYGGGGFGYGVDWIVKTKVIRGIGVKMGRVTSYPRRLTSIENNRTHQLGSLACYLLERVSYGHSCQGGKLGVTKRQEGRTTCGEEKV